MLLNVFSPAKINLFLRVLGKRLDGYHELSSLFQAIDLGDELDFELDDQDSLVCNQPHIPTDSSNLILKAIQLFKRKTGLTIGLKVRLRKVVPIQAGLGGGSSNAATTLWAFNQLTGQPATLQELQAWASELGSDVPFFFSNGTALCQGRGETVQDLKPLEGTNVWIVKLPVGLSTPDVYRQLNMAASPTAFSCHSKDALSFVLGKPHYFNDLELPAFALQPSLKDLKENLLQHGFETVLMTGSGSAFFCIGDQGKIPEIPHLFAFKARFLNRLENNWYSNDERISQRAFA
jgi:4-diphosphocytidyl-2-C-methyl-D-erythritol kinase